MKERFVEISQEAERKQEERFTLWLLGEGVPFENEKTQAAYRERILLIKDAIQLEKSPARIPVCPSAGFFPIQNAGITMKQAMYDYETLMQAWIQYHDDYAPDAYNGPTNIVPGSVLDILDFRLYQWPGHGVSDEREYQFVEGEYMKAEEYQDLIDDPTGFFLNRYFPRIFGALKSLENIPLLPAITEIPNVPPLVMPFGRESMQGAFQTLVRAGEEALRWRRKVKEINDSIMSRGYPAFSGGFTKAPFDVIGDSLRGTRGVMLDLFRYPDEVKEACERLTPIMVKSGVTTCRATGHLMPFIPLHKGADGFMSDGQFREFYWPTLRKLIIGLVNEGMVPLLFAEGSYNQRLDIVSDIPRGKVVWWFDRTDMRKAKETLGTVACLAGNFPLDLLYAGSPNEVERHCRELIEMTGQDGGFIFSTGAGMQGARPENVKRMVDTVREYGAINMVDERQSI